MTPREGLNFAITLFGSEVKLARAINFSPDALNRAKWLGKATPDMANNIEVVTGGQVTRQILRPDIFNDNPKLVKNSWTRGHLRSRRRR